MADVSVLESKAQDDGRTSTTSDEVYEKLRLAIVTGEIRPNAPLIEVDLANALKVSRTPIRESLQRLAADQLVVPRKRGWAVKEYSAQEIQESYEVRAALEGYAARLAATRASDDEIAAITEIQRLRDAETNPTREFRVRTNRQFHDGIIKAARNEPSTEADGSISTSASRRPPREKTSPQISPTTHASCLRCNRATPPGQKRPCAHIY